MTPYRNDDPPSDCDLPETCPVCGKDNGDPETGDWLDEASAPYCCAECAELGRQALAEQARMEDAALAHDLAEGERLVMWWADNESENGRYGVYECREDGDPGRTVSVVGSREEADRLVREHNGKDPLAWTKDYSPENDPDTFDLDGYGHLEYAFGNEDWLACFDADRRGDSIAWHVVVDCESGGFTDTIEKGVVSATEACVAGLRKTPMRYVDMCMERYGNEDPTDEENYHGPIEWEEALARWNEHLDHLLTSKG